MTKPWLILFALLLLGGCADVAPTMPQENPVPGSTLSSGFGSRENDPIKGYTPGAHHDGYDLAAKDGDPIHPSRDGVVVFTGFVAGYGNTVVVKHDEGWTTLYGHAKKIRAKVGDKVTTKSVLALVGSTGRSTGPHLHYELRQNGVPVDPMGFDPSSGSTSIQKARLPEPPKLPPARLVKQIKQGKQAKQAKQVRNSPFEKVTFARSESVKLSGGKRKSELKQRTKRSTPVEKAKMNKRFAPRPIPLGKPSTTR